MFQNYLVASLRFFSRNKGYSLINILGLSIGPMVSIIPNRPEAHHLPA